MQKNSIIETGLLGIPAEHNILVEKGKKWFRNLDERTKNNSRKITQKLYA